MWNNNKCENGDEKKRDRRRCRQQTKRRLEKIGDARAATLIVRLFSFVFISRCLSGFLFLLVSCARVCVRHPRNRKQISRISHSHSYGDHINAFLVQRRSKKKTESEQKQRKQVIEITFNVSMFVRWMSVAPKCGTGFFIWSAGVRRQNALMWRSRQKVHTRQIEDLRNAINATTDNSSGWCRARYGATAAKKALRHGGNKTENWIEIKDEVARQRLFKTHSLSG